LIEVIPADGNKTFKEFLHFPFKLYRRDSLWVPPLLTDIKKRFSPENPFFKHAEVAPFIAKNNGETVGRITAIYNEAHISFTGEKAGFFGFFDCIDNMKTANALFNRVIQWLKAKGMILLRGPMNFSSNDEWGLLIEGHDSPPMLMMPYNYPYFQTLLDNCGFTKAKDLYAYIIDVPETLPEKTFRVAAIAAKQNLKVRPIDLSSFDSEMKIFKGIYNSAWEKTI
jgi:hypothetical protein